MPRTFWLFSIRHTTIILVNSNLNMIEGDLRHMDRSTTTTIRDAFNLESTVTEQPPPPTTPLAPTPLVSPNPSAARHEHDTDRTSSTSETPSNPPSTRGSRPTDMAVSVHSTVSNSSTTAHVFMLTSIPSGEDFTV